MFGIIYLIVSTAIVLGYIYSLHKDHLKEREEYKRQIEELLRKGR